MSNVINFPDISDRVREEETKRRENNEPMYKMTSKGIDNLCKDQRIDEQFNIIEFDPLVEQARKAVKKFREERSKSLHSLIMYTALTQQDPFDTVDELVYKSYKRQRDTGNTYDRLKKAGFPKSDDCELRYQDEKVSE